MDIEKLSEFVDYLNNNESIDQYYQVDKKYKIWLTPEYFETILGYLDTGYDALNISRMMLQPHTGEKVQSEEQEKTVVDKIENPETDVYIVRFSTNLESFVNPDLDLIYNNLKVNSRVVCKKFYGYPIQSVDNPSIRVGKLISEYVNSEHKEGQKELVRNVVECLYVNDDIVFRCIVSNTGKVFLKIESNIHYSKFIHYLEELNKNIKIFFKELSGKSTGDIDPEDVKVKVLYTHGFLHTETISKLEKIDIKNSKLQVNIYNIPVTYSSNDFFMNFNCEAKLEQIPELKIQIEKKIKWYFKNSKDHDCLLKPDGEIEITSDFFKTSIKKIYIILHEGEYRGKYLYKKYENGKIYLISEHRVQKPKHFKSKYYLSRYLKEKTELRVDSKICEKKRRPILYDGIRPDDETFMIKNTKYTCPEPYKYHSVIKDIDCCFKNKRTPDRKDGETIEQARALSKKKTPLKKFTNVGKFSEVDIPWNIQKYFDKNFSLLSTDEKKEDRTIVSCLSLLYGNNLETLSVDSLSKVNYERYFDQSFTTSFDIWKSQDKDIDELILAISIYKRINILVVKSNNEVFCPNIFDFEKSVVIYCEVEPKIETYYLIVNRKGLEAEHKTKDITKLIDDMRSVCGIINLGIPSFYSHIEAQVLDMNGMVVFLQLKNFGNIQVLESEPNQTVQSISAKYIKLLSPESQYNALVLLSNTYPELKPVSVTRTSDLNFVTGIVTENGSVSPVVQKQWVTDLPKSEKMFYIERYTTQTEEYVDKEIEFLKAVEDVKNAGVNQQISDLVKILEYNGLIKFLRGYVKEELLAKVTWYFMNNS